jgi:hypothetical protein
LAALIIASMGATEAKVTPIITGRRMPTPGKPRDWTKDAKPQARISALISSARCSGARPSAPARISGTATAPAYITRTCCSPNAARRGGGSNSSTPVAVADMPSPLPILEAF